MIDHQREPLGSGGTSEVRNRRGLPIHPYRASNVHGTIAFREVVGGLLAGLRRAVTELA